MERTGKTKKMITREEEREEERTGKRNHMFMGVCLIIWCCIFSFVPFFECGVGPCTFIDGGGRDVILDSSGYYSVIHTEKRESRPDE